MSTKKIIVIILSSVVVMRIVIGLQNPDTPETKQFIPPISDTANRSNTTVPADQSDQSGIIISTDKTEYDKGETIEILVNNKSDIPVLYYNSDRFWDIEYFEDNGWTNYAHKEGGNFQLTKEKAGGVCFISLYERTEPTELKSKYDLSVGWNQNICPFGAADPTEPRTVSGIESGRYRLTFIYGLGTSADDRFNLSDPKTMYSDSFVIK